MLRVLGSGEIGSIQIARALVTVAVTGHFMTAVNDTAHEMRVTPGDPAQRRGIEGQQGVADDGYPQQMDDGKGDAEFTAGEHRAGEKGKAEQHHGDGKYAFASGGGRFDEGKIIAV